MFSFSKRSSGRLEECHPDLQKLFFEVIKHVDCTVICGFRNEADQMEAFRAGKSRVTFPNSKHNLLPSMAVDVVPFPIDWSDLKRFYMFVGFVRGIAKSMNINIRCGADWDGDFDIKDQNFHDLPHFELIGEKTDV